MAAAKPKVVFLLVDSPNQSRVIEDGQQPTTMACYPCPIDGTIEDTIKRGWMEHAIPPGSKVLATTDSRCDHYRVVPALEAV